MESRTSTGSAKIAAFDLDYTLLKPNGKHRFPKHRDDAMLLYPEVTPKLEQLYKEKYKIVIFTNQSGIGKHITVADIYYKIDNYLSIDDKEVKNLNSVSGSAASFAGASGLRPRDASRLPRNGAKIDVYISYKHDHRRKPMPGMFDQFMKDNGPITDIFYVGDAAGRKGDHSASDAQFAHNCGIPFYTPEQFFLGQDNPAAPVPRLKPPLAIPLKRGIPAQMVVILIGPPGCGKSTLSQSLATRYPETVIVNNDTTGSEVKSMHIFKQALAARAPRIIIDNTNATILNRAGYAELAKDREYKVCAITISVSRELATHLNYYRSYTQEKLVVPEIAYASFYKRLELVKKSEAYNLVLDYVPELPAVVFEYSFI